MPANLKDLKNRIKSVKSTQQITKAMKLVAAAKFGRAQHAVVAARPYSEHLGKLVSNLLQSIDNGAPHAFVKDGECNTALVVVISSERGLCGGYNSNIIKMATRTIEDLQNAGKQVSILCIGKKAYQVLSKRYKYKAEGPTTVTPAQYVANPDTLVNVNQPILLTTSFERPTFDLIAKLTESVAKTFETGTVGKVVVVYNKFQSAMTQIPTAETVLPMQVPVSITANMNSSMLVEPGVQELLETALPRFLATQLFQVFLEAVASEHGARMSAMDNATRNAKEMQRKYEISYQRARQAAITNELIEIISGAEAL